MQQLLTVLAMWLSVNFGLPAEVEHPRIEFAAAAKMAQVRYSRASQRPGHTAVEVGNRETAAFGQTLVAIYDDVDRTIYLPDRWSGVTAAEISVLVHELVHYLQNVGRRKYECAQAREKVAYAAQERWLGLFGTSLQKEFGLDRVTVMLRTKCMF